MTVVGLLEKLRALDVRLWSEQGQLKISAPRGVLTPELTDELRRLKPELLAHLRELDGHLERPLRHPDRLGRDEHGRRPAERDRVGVERLGADAACGDGSEPSGRIHGEARAHGQGLGVDDTDGVPPVTW